MNRFYKHSKLLICSDIENICDTYKNYFKKNFLNIDTLLLTKNFNLKVVNSFDIVLIDINSIESLSFLEYDSKAFRKNKTILLLPTSKKRLKKEYLFLDGLDLILSKPINFNSLKLEIVDFAKGIENRIVLEDKYSSLIDVVNFLPHSLAIFDLHQKLYFANKKFLTTNKLEYKDFGVKNYSKLFGSEISFEEVLIALQNSNGNTYEQTLNLNSRWYKITFYQTSEEHLVCINEDITEEKEKEKKLEQSAVFFEHSTEGIVICDSKNNIVSVNNAFCKITGYTKDQVIGENPSFLSSGMHDRFFYDNMWESINQRRFWQGEVWNKRKNGEIYPQWLSISKILSTESKSDYYLAIFTDISSLKENDKKVHYYANHDSLTGLLNRTSFDTYLGQIIETSLKKDMSFALFFIDIDNFKYINDTYGHDTGDSIIKIVSKRINSMIRAGDIFARIGGDEFTLVMSEVKSKADVIAHVESILEKVSLPIKINDLEFNITLSIGISTFPEDSTIKKDLLKNADAAMYVVKANGRNGYKFFNKSFLDHFQNRFDIQNDLKKAIEEEIIEVYYQPYFHSKNSILIGAEALVRWKHQGKGFISPLDFISYAESTGLIKPLTKYVLRRSCEALVLIKQRYNKEFKMSINISAKHFYDKSFEDDLLEVINDFGLSPYDFELELTETYIMKNHDQSVKIINSLNKKGFNFAIDDFGTGYSSLSYLKKFSLNKLKIDKSFVQDCQFDTNDKTIIKTIVSMSKMFGFKVQAEGVETIEQLKILQDLECDYIQGYYYSKAIEISQFIKAIDEWKTK